MYIDDDGRMLESYQSYNLVVAKQGVVLKGRASPDYHGKTIGLPVVKVDLADAAEPLQRLKQAVDDALCVRNRNLRTDIAARHEAYLAKVGILSKGRKPFVGPRFRDAKCHHCGSAVSNLEAPECVACRAIICLHCAACHCGTVWGGRGLNCQ